jgi:hypothetical protein
MDTMSAVVAGALALLGAALGHLLGRVTAREQERWRRREETMRLLRWAADAASEPEGRRIEVGIAALTALTTSPLVDPEDDDFVWAVLAATRHQRAYAERGGQGGAHDDDRSSDQG